MVVFRSRDSNTTERMPEIVLQTNSLSTGTSNGGPPAAFLSMQQQQPKALRILKRPSNSTSPSQQTAAPVPSMKEREAAYAAARDRIFNAPSPTLGIGGTPVDPSPSATPPPTRMAGRGSGLSYGVATNNPDQGASVGRISRDPIQPAGIDRGFDRRSQNADKASHPGSWDV
jgi:hypothetical protein